MRLQLHNTVCLLVLRGQMPGNNLLVKNPAGDLDLAFGGEAESRPERDRPSVVRAPQG